MTRAVSIDDLAEIAELLAKQPEGDARRARITSLAGDETRAQRATAFLPEAFGLVLASHVAELTLPTTFSAKDAAGQWHEIPFAAEPLFRDSVKLAMETFHAGERELFEALALSSATMATVNAALNAGTDLEGSVLAGPAFVGVQAEWYLPT